MGPSYVTSVSPDITNCCFSLDIWHWSSRFSPKRELSYVIPSLSASNFACSKSITKSCTFVSGFLFVSLSLLFALKSLIGFSGRKTLSRASSKILTPSLDFRLSSVNCWATCLALPIWGIPCKYIINALLLTGTLVIWHHILISFFHALYPLPSLLNIGGPLFVVLQAIF